MDHLIEFIKEDGSGESWIVSEDTRHGQKGYRAIRYLPDPHIPNNKNCDERYMFFTSIDEAFKAFKNCDLKAGRTAF